MDFGCCVGVAADAPTTCADLMFDACLYKMYLFVNSLTS
jgi:hypothetical protein